jgi:hypothetical protein
MVEIDRAFDATVADAWNRSTDAVEPQRERFSLRLCVSA